MAEESNIKNIFDVIVIGGGVVGLSILREVTLKGFTCALIEATPHLVSKASGSNSGIACTGVDAEPGSLERALIRDSISRIRLFCKHHNVPMRECGSLVCLWPWDIHHSDHNDKQENIDANGNAPRVHNEQLEEVAHESWEAGDSNAAILNKSKVLSMEPALSSKVKGAVYIPGEIVLDPWLFPIALASHARENGAAIYTSFPYCPKSCSFDTNTKLWTIVKPELHCDKNSNNLSPKTLFAKSIVNATGIQSDVTQLETEGIPKPSWEAKPRRGQYRIFSMSQKQKHALIHPIQPVPTPRTKGIFVFSTLYNQIVVGPTADDQESRTNITPEIKVAAELTRHAHRILDGYDDYEPSNTFNPNINDSNTLESSYVGEYVGIRPGTNHRDYQIHLIPDKHWISAAGIRSTGLTASLGIGRYVMDLLSIILPQLKYNASDDANTVTARDTKTHTPKLTPLPDVKTLAEQFRNSEEGSVKINGYLYKVTHPITKLGWTYGTGLAKP